MKKLTFLLAIGMILSIGCKKDNEENFAFSYDGPNLTGPILEVGYHEAAARFTSNETNAYSGKQLTSVSFFMGVVPQKVEVIIYAEGNDDAPGAELYRANVTTGIQVPEWNEHTLSTPIDIDGNDLWISIGLTHDQQSQSIGCDAGPNVANGDWLFKASDNLWSPFGVRIPGESVNWNIRGKVSE